MLKMRELHEVPALFDLMTHPEVFPYVRQKANTVDELYFLTRQTIEAELNQMLISRTITDEFHQPIGTINLFDLENNHGFLATWIGRPYFGKGYNRLAKEAFFNELFQAGKIEGIFMKVRRTNIRSLKAVLKLPYITLANETYPDIFNKLNQCEHIYDLFLISRANYLAYQQFLPTVTLETGEGVS